MFILKDFFNLFACEYFQVCGEPEKVQRAVELLPETLETSAIVFSRVENMYTTYELHNLP